MGAGSVDIANQSTEDQENSPDFEIFVTLHPNTAYTFLLTNPLQKSKLFSSLCSAHTLPVGRSAPLMPSALSSSALSMPQSVVMPSTRACTPPSASSVTTWSECSQWR